jgi:hypothetical protein
MTTKFLFYKEKGSIKKGSITTNVIKWPFHTKTRRDSDLQLFYGLIKYKQSTPLFFVVTVVSRVSTKNRPSLVFRWGQFHWVKARAHEIEAGRQRKG